MALMNEAPAADQPGTRSGLAEAVLETVRDPTDLPPEASDHSSCLSDDSVPRDQTLCNYPAEYIEITTCDISELKQRVQQLEEQLRHSIL